MMTKKYPRTSIYFNEANRSKINSLFPDMPFSEIVNKCCAYILQQPTPWIKQFLERQPVSYLGVNP